MIMRKLFYKHGHFFVIFLAILIYSISAWAVDTWHGTDQVTMAWDASLLADGSPVPAGDTVKYYVYTKNEDGSNVTVAGSTTELTYTFTIPEGVKLIPGVSAARVVADGTETDQSQVAWADDPQYCENGVTFGFINYKKAGPPNKLRKQ